MKRERIVGAYPVNCGEGRAAVGEIVLAVDLEPRHGRERSLDMREMGRAQADSRRYREVTAGRHRHAGPWLREKRRSRGVGNGDQAFGGADLPPIVSHVPLSTYFHSVGSLSTLAPCAAHACFAVPQSFWPALATP
jgi:hypothetical protein